MLKFILTLLAVYLFVGLLLYLMQRSMLYFPTAEARRADTDVLWLDHGDERLKIWRLNRGDNALIYFGGNAEPVEYNIDAFRRMFPRHTVYLVNYRGYGGSSGRPTERNLFNDALHLYDSIRDQYASIDVIGRSLGSGVACFLAAQREIRNVALITPYDSISRLAATHYPIFPVRFLIKDTFDSLSRAEKLENRILALLAEVDQVVPRKHSERLIEGLKNARVTTSIVPKTSHNDILDAPRAIADLQAFFNQP